MKQQFFAIIGCVLSTFSIQAQDAKVSSIEINKITQPCVVAQYPIKAALVDGAMRKKLSDAKLGSGDKTKDGFRVYKGVVIPEIASEKIDVYFKVDEKASTSTLYMLTSKGYDNFMKMDPDSEAVNHTIHYLNAFVKDATAFMLNDDIIKQQATIKEVEKNMKSIEKDATSLQKKKLKSESKISNANIESSGLKSEMENQQKALELVRTKTATIDQVDALKKEVAKQESVTKKATKNYNSSVEEVADLKQNLAEIEKEIETNQAEQNKLRVSLENEKRKLEELQMQLSYLK